MSRSGDSIDQFRIRREQELFENQFRVRAAQAHQGMLRLLQENEKKDQIARQVSAEMEEFFLDSTRIAARVFGSIEEKKAHSIEQQVINEMEDFFSQLTQKVESIVQTISLGETPKTQLDSELEKLLESPLKPLGEAAAAIVKHHDPNTHD